MDKIGSVIKSEIVRLAGKELRAVCGPLGRDVRQLKRKVSQLRKIITPLSKAAAEWSKQAMSTKAELGASEEEVKAARFSPRLIRSLRTRLGISQDELGALVGVTGVSVGFWEQGRNRPSGANRAVLVALRKLGKREVREILKTKEPAKGKPARAARKARKRRKGPGGLKRQAPKARRILGQKAGARKRS